MLRFTSRIALLVFALLFSVNPPLATAQDDLSKRD